MVGSEYVKVPVSSNTMTARLTVVRVTPARVAAAQIMAHCERPTDMNSQHGDLDCLAMHVRNREYAHDTREHARLTERQRPPFSG